MVSEFAGAGEESRTVEIAAGAEMGKATAIGSLMVKICELDWCGVLYKESVTENFSESEKLGTGNASYRLHQRGSAIILPSLNTKKQNH